LIEEESLLSKDKNKPEDEVLMTLIDDKKRGISRRNLMGCVLIPGKHIQKVYLDLNSKDDLTVSDGTAVNNADDSSNVGNKTSTASETASAK